MLVTVPPGRLHLGLPHLVPLPMEEGERPHRVPIPPGCCVAFLLAVIETLSWSVYIQYKIVFLPRTLLPSTAHLDEEPLVPVGAHYEGDLVVLAGLEQLERLGRQDGVRHQPAVHYRLERERCPDELLYF